MTNEPIFESLLDALFVNAELRELMTVEELQRLRQELAAETLPTRDQLLEALAKDDR
jgi:hypothetical protein